MHQGKSQLSIEKYNEERENTYMCLKNTTKKEKTPTCALGSHWRTYSNGCLAFKQQTSMESFRLLG